MRLKAERLRAHHREPGNSQRAGGRDEVFALKREAIDGFLNALAAGRVFHADDFAVEWRLYSVCCRDGVSNLFAGLVSHARVGRANQVAQRRPFEHTPIGTLVFAQPHVLDAQRVVDDVTMGVVGKAGVLVFLGLAV